MESIPPMNTEQTGTTATGIRAPLSFLSGFAVLFIAVTHYLGAILPDAVIAAMIRATGEISAAFLRLVGFEASFRYPLIVMSRFTMEVNLECTAVHYMALYTAGVLLYPYQRTQRKLLGLAGGLAVIVFLNMLRIGTVGIIGVYSPAASDFVHAYLWQGTFACMVIALWIAWIRGLSLFDKPAMRFAVVFLLSAAMAILGLGLIIEWYARMLAVVADKLFAIIPGVPNLSVSTYEVYGSAIIYFDGAHAYTYSIAADIYDAAILFGLLIASRERRTLVIMARNLSAGAAIMVVLHLFYILGIGTCFSRTPDSMLGHPFFAIRGISILSPFLVWLVLMRLSRQLPQIAAGEVEKKHGIGRNIYCL